MVEIQEIFKTIGQPTITYVQRESGKLENILKSALSEKGQLCLVTGPSKTGKTTLYKQVIEDRNEVPLIVPCDRAMKCKDIWLRALESVQFERIETKTSTVSRQGSLEVEAGAKFGWKWLAEATTRLKGSVNKQTSEVEARKKSCQSLVLTF